MASTSTTTFGSAIAQIWKRDVIKIATDYAMVDKFAINNPVGKGEGGTLIFNRVLRPSKQTSAGTFGTLITSSSARSLTSNKVSVTPKLLQDVFSVDDGVSIESFIQDQSIKKTIGLHASHSLNYDLMKTICQQACRHRVDKSATYQKSGTATGGSTTTLLDTATFTAADNGYVGGYVGIVNPDGPNYDHPFRKVTASTSSTKTLTTTDTFGQANTTASKYRYVVATGYDSGSANVLTTSALWDVQALHMQAETDLFGDGFLRCFLHPLQDRDLWNDSIFQNSAIYDDSGRFRGYKIQRWAGIEFLIGPQSTYYREDVDGTENQSGVVFNTPIFGQDSYIASRWGHGDGSYGLEFIPTMDSDSGNLMKNAWFMAWKAVYYGLVSRSTNVINLLTQATTSGVQLYS